MLKPATRYPVQTIAEAAYPNGRARNVSAPGAGDGFPLEQDWVNDLLGYDQAIAAAAEVVPNDTPDTALASQKLEALRTLMHISAGGAALANAEIKNNVTGAGNHFRDVCYGEGAGDPGYRPGLFLAVGIAGANRRYALSYEGVSWTATTPTGDAFNGCAHGGPGAMGSKDFLLVGMDAVGRCKIWSAPANFAIGLVLTERTPSPQPQARSMHAVWNGNAWHVVGYYNGSRNAQALISADLSSWSSLTAANSYMGNFLRSAALPNGRVIAVGSAGVIQVIDDEGASITEVFNDNAVGDLSSIIRVGSGNVLLAAGGGNKILRSIDGGNTFETLEPALIANPNAAFATESVECLAELGGAVVAIVKATIGQKRMGVLSFDRGATWTKVFRVAGGPFQYVHRAAASDGSRVVFCGGDAALATAGFCSATTRIGG